MWQKHDPFSVLDSRKWRRADHIYLIYFGMTTILEIFLTHPSHTVSHTLTGINQILSRAILAHLFLSWIVMSSKLDGASPILTGFSPIIAVQCYEWPPLRNSYLFHLLLLSQILQNTCMIDSFFTSTLLISFSSWVLLFLLEVLHSSLFAKVDSCWPFCLWFCLFATAVLQNCIPTEKWLSLTEWSLWARQKINIWKPSTHTIVSPFSFTHSLIVFTSCSVISQCLGQCFIHTWKGYHIRNKFHIATKEQFVDTHQVLNYSPHSCLHNCCLATTSYLCHFLASNHHLIPVWANTGLWFCVDHNHCYWLFHWQPLLQLQCMI